MTYNRCNGVSQSYQVFNLPFAARRLILNEKFCSVTLSFLFNFSLAFRRERDKREQCRIYRIVEASRACKIGGKILWQYL